MAGRATGSGQAVAAGQFLRNEGVARGVGGEGHGSQQRSAQGGSQGIELFHGISPSVSNAGPDWRPRSNGRGRDAGVTAGEKSFRSPDEIRGRFTRNQSRLRLHGCRR